MFPVLVAEGCIIEDTYYSTAVTQAGSASTWEDCQSQCQNSVSCALVHFHPSVGTCDQQTFAPASDELTGQIGHVTILRHCISGKWHLFSSVVSFRTARG